MQQNTPEQLLAAITRAGNDVTQGWMRLMAAAPDLQRTSQRYAELHAAYAETQARLWAAMLAGDKTSVVEPAVADRRFSSREWSDNPYFDYLRQSYLLASRHVEALLESAELAPAEKERARFAARQWIDAMSPANFAATNPAALRQALETQGESLTRGLANLLGDAQKGRLSQSDESAFELGRNLGVTPGEVVYENDLIQLIQYRPSTPRVASRPLVIVPPCINKFYVLDLQPENSFARYAVERGHTVFMVSWRNVGAEQGHLGWDDYLEEGVLKALEISREITGADRVNALGFCVGGTLLGAALAVLSHRNHSFVSSATFLATMLDFSDTGAIGLFVDEASVAAREAAIGRAGIFPGSDLAFVFSSLRANDLIWPYVVNNYLLGEAPGAFDILYWNADSTNLPGPMYCYYLRHTYLENRLREPGALVNCGAPVDLGSIEAPVFVLATREDHIVPWRSAYRTLGLVGSRSKTFVLGASGHIAGVVNPASKNKRSFWVNQDSFSSGDDWLEKATEHRGSWWPVWADWLAQHAGAERDAPSTPGNRRYAAIEAAPGRYVKERIH
ncbi:MAG TPA: class I poly(R)-hydroxyalkanoic acid synthase [Burkholderiales bacterium]